MKKTLFAAALVIAMTAIGTNAMAQATIKVDSNRLTITNQGNAAITQLLFSYEHIEADDRNELDRQIAPGASIAPGSSLLLRADPTAGCIVQVSAFYADGHAQRVTVNTCEAQASPRAPDYVQGVEEE